MNQIIKTYILGGLLLYILYLLYLKLNKNTETYESFAAPNSYSKTWATSMCLNNIPENIIKVLNENNVKKTNSTNNANLLIPCGYDYIEDEINNFKLNNKNKQNVFILHNTDHIVGKEVLWLYLVKKYGLHYARTMIPNSFALNYSGDLERLKREHSPDKLYIVKKNIQRQEGLEIVRTYKEIIDARDRGYIVAQELLQDPYTVNKRKINMRFYVLCVHNEGKLNVYVFNDGFMYYTPEFWQRHSKDFKHNITTGYIDRKVYEENPLTHSDFRTYLDLENRELTDQESYIINTTHKQLSEYVFNKIYVLIARVFKAYDQVLGKGDKLKDHLSFQLYGVDIAINDRLEPMIMEVNKGPDLGSKDGRDGDLKRKCINDMFAIVGITKTKANEKNGFIKLNVV